MNFKYIAKRFLRLVFYGVIGFAIIQATTYGWHGLMQDSAAVNKENTILAKQLKKHVYKLSHTIGNRSVFEYEKLMEAEEYIKKQFISFGYKVKFQSYKAYGKEVRNIIAVKKGKSRPEEIIILGAHYDSCYNPGADDNSSAVAGLLEVARMLSEKDTGKTIKFIAFVNEEPPFFHTNKMGSRVYSRAAKGRGDNIKGVIILEMIGYYSDKSNSQNYPSFFGLFYPNKGNFIATVGNFQSRKLLNNLVTAFKKNSDFPIESITTFSFIPGVDFSDHWSFWQEGYPAVMVTDTSFYRNPNYHKQSDTYDTLDYNSMAEVVKGVRLAIEEITK